MDKKTVLCVDDEPSILRSLERSLAPGGYVVLAAVGGEAGLKMLAERAGRVDVLVVDQRMPRMSGEDFLDRVQETYGVIPALMLSGYADPVILVRAVNRGVVRRFLAKPWDNAELLEVVEALARGEAGTAQDKEKDL